MIRCFLGTSRFRKIITRREGPILFRLRKRLNKSAAFQAEIVETCQLYSGIKITELLRLKYAEIAEDLGKGWLPLKVALRNARSYWKL